MSEDRGMMSDPVIISMISATQVIILAIIAARNHSETRKSVQAVNDKVEITARSIDGRMDELVVASKAQGAQEQRDETRKDAKDAAKELAACNLVPIEHCKYPVKEPKVTP